MTEVSRNKIHLLHKIREKNVAKQNMFFPSLSLAHLVSREVFLLSISRNKSKSKIYICSFTFYLLTKLLHYCIIIKIIVKRIVANYLCYF